jgi:hypothetical protein
MNHTFDRNEILEIVLEHRAESIPFLEGVGCISTAEAFVAELEKLPTGSERGNGVDTEEPSPKP